MGKISDRTNPRGLCNRGRGGPWNPRLGIACGDLEVHLGASGAPVLMSLIYHHLSTHLVSCLQQVNQPTPEHLFQHQSHG